MRHLFTLLAFTLTLFSIDHSDLYYGINGNVIDISNKKQKMMLKDEYIYINNKKTGLKYDLYNVYKADNKIFAINEFDEVFLMQADMKLKESNCSTMGGIIICGDDIIDLISTEKIYFTVKKQEVKEGGLKEDLQGKVYHSKSKDDSNKKTNKEEDLFEEKEAPSIKRGSKSVKSSSNNSNEDSMDEDNDNEDSIDEDNDNEDSIDEDSMDEDSIDEDSIDEDSIDEDSIDEDSIDEDTMDEDSDNKDTMDEDSDNKDTMDEDSDNKDTMDEDTDNEDSDNKDTMDEDTDNEDSDNKDTMDEDTDNEDSIDKGTMDEDNDNEDSIDKDTIDEDSDKEIIREDILIKTIINNESDNSQGDFIDIRIEDNIIGDDIKLKLKKKFGGIVLNNEVVELINKSGKLEKFIRVKVDTNKAANDIVEVYIKGSLYAEIEVKIVKSLKINMDIDTLIQYVKINAKNIGNTNELIDSFKYGGDKYDVHPLLDNGFLRLRIQVKEDGNDILEIMKDNFLFATIEILSEKPSNVGLEKTALSCVKGVFSQYLGLNPGGNPITSNRIVKNDMDYLISNPYFRIKEEESNLKNICNMSNIEMNINIKLPTLDGLKGQLTEGITDISSLLIDNISNLTSPEMMMAIQMKMLAYPIAGLVCIDKVMLDPKIKTAVSTKISACVSEDAPPEAKSCGAMGVGTHIKGGGGATSKSDPYAAMTCIGKSIKDMELIPAVSACMDGEIPKVSETIFIKVKRLVKAKKGSKAIKREECKLDQKADNIFKVAKVDLLSATLNSINPFSDDPCEKYTSRNSEIQCLSQFYSRKTYADEKGAIQLLTNKMVKENISKYMAKKDKIRIMVKENITDLIKKHMATKMFNNPFLNKNLVYDYENFGATLIKAITEKGSTKNNLNEFCKFNTNKELDLFDKESHSYNDCNVFNGKISFINSFISLSKQKISVKDETLFPNIYIHNFDVDENGVVEKYTIYNLKILKKLVKNLINFTFKIIDSGIPKETLVSKSIQINDDENAKSLEKKDILDLIKKAKEREKNKKGVFDKVIPPFSPHINLECKSISFEFNSFALIRDIIKDIIMPLIDQVPTPGKVNVPKFDMEDQIMLYLSTVSSAVCLFEQGNPFQIKKITDESNKCLEKTDAGELGGGGELGIDFAGAFPMPDGSGAIDSCTNTSSLIKMGKCIGEAYSTVYGAEFNKCVQNKNKSILELLQTSQKKYKGVSFAIKESKKQKCQIKNKVNETKIKMDLSLTSMSLSLDKSGTVESYKEIENTYKNKFLHQLRSEYLNNENSIHNIEDYMSGVLFRYIAYKQYSDDGNDAVKIVTTTMLKKAMIFSLDSWYYSLDEINWGGDLQNYTIYNDNNEVNELTNGFKTLFDDVYSINLKNILPSDSFLRVVKIPKLLSMESRNKVSDILCRELRSGIKSMGSGEVNNEVNIWLNTFRNNVYRKIFGIKSHNTFEIVEEEDFDKIGYKFERHFRLKGLRSLNSIYNKEEKGDFELFSSVVNEHCGNIEKIKEGYRKLKIKRQEFEEANAKIKVQLKKASSKKRYDIENDKAFGERLGYTNEQSKLIEQIKSSADELLKELSYEKEI